MEGAEMGHSDGASGGTQCRGVRGAISVPTNDSASIIAATAELLDTLFRANEIDPSDLASVIFTSTPDLDATFPAKAARQFKLDHIALLCAQEIAAAEALPLCVRVLLHWNTPKSAAEIEHIYLGEAVSLRPDRAPSSVPMDHGRSEP